MGSADHNASPQITQSSQTVNTESNPSHPEDKSGQPHIVRRPKKSEEEHKRDHEAYLKRMDRARALCLAELLLPIGWLENKWEEMHYMINERTGRPNDAVFITVDKVATIVAQSREPIKLEDEITIDDQHFSRSRFYNNRAFQDELKAYYAQYKFGCRLTFQQRSGRWNMLITW